MLMGKWARRLARLRWKVMGVLTETRAKRLERSRESMEKRVDKVAMGEIEIGRDLWRNGHSMH